MILFSVTGCYVALLDCHTRLIAIVITEWSGRIANKYSNVLPQS